MTRSFSSHLQPSFFHHQMPACHPSFLFSSLYDISVSYSEMACNLSSHLQPLFSPHQMAADHLSLVSIELYFKMPPCFFSHSTLIFPTQDGSRSLVPRFLKLYFKMPRCFFSHHLASFFFHQMAADHSSLISSSIYCIFQTLIVSSAIFKLHFSPTRWQPIAHSSVHLSFSSPSILMARAFLGETGEGSSRQRYGVFLSAWGV